MFGLIASIKTIKQNIRENIVHYWNYETNTAQYFLVYFEMKKYSPCLKVKKYNLFFKEYY
jgi:hypothetical protein